MLIQISQMPAADIFQFGTSLAGRTEKLLIAAAGAVVVYLLVKWLGKANGFVAALMALIGAAVLMWALNNVTNPNLQRPLDDTLNGTTNGISRIDPSGGRSVIDQARGA